jgi:hypothetical protein
MGANLDVCPDDENMCAERPYDRSKRGYENMTEPCPGPGTVDGHEIHLLGKHKDFDEYFFSFDDASVHSFRASEPSGLGSARQTQGRGGRGAVAREIMDVLMKNAGFPSEDEDDIGAAGVVLPPGLMSSFRSASASFASLSSIGSFASAMSGNASARASAGSQQSKQQFAKKSILRLVSSLMRGSFVIMHSDEYGLTECTMQLDKGLSMLVFCKQGELLFNVARGLFFSGSQYRSTLSG